MDCTVIGNKTFSAIEMDVKEKKRQIDKVTL